MTLLLLGLALFLIPHLYGLNRDAKKRLKAKIGDGPYKGGHTLLSIAGIVLVVIGYQQADITPVYEPLSSRAVPHALMPFSFILLAGANMPSNLKRYVRHPMALGVMLWAVSHLAVNGDVASLILFGAFGLFALLDFVISPVPPTPPLQPRTKDLMLVVAGMIAYAVVVWAHGAVGGVYVIS